MPIPALAAVARALDPDPPADADLLTRFAETRDESAFAELLRRHGPMVLGTCRRVLADPHDADDAFQAVFVVLARRAGSVRPPGRVGPWLYGVAVKTATKAKIMAAKRRRHEQASGGRKLAVAHDATGSDLRPVIDEELARLPEKLRAPVVLCDLGGKSRSEAARELGWPEGTLATRLAKARELLAARLTRRGVTLPAAGVAALLASGSAAAVPPALAAAALAAALGGSAAAVPPAVQLLAEGVVRSMRATYWKLGAVAALVASGLVAGGAAVVAGGGPADRPGAGPPAGTVPVVAPAPAAGGRGPWRERAAADAAKNAVFAVAFAPDGRAFVTGSGHDFPLPGVAGGRPDPNATATAGAAVCRDAATLKVRWVFQTGRDQEVAAAYSPDGATVAAAAGDKVYFLDAATGKLAHTWDDVEGRAVAWSPDGKRLAVSNGWRTRVIGLPPGGGETAMAGPGLGGGPGKLTAGVAWSPDGKRLALIRHEKSDGKWPVVAWGAGSGEPMKLLAGHADTVHCVAWSADGTRLASGGADGAVVVWDGRTFAEVRRMEFEGRAGKGVVRGVAFSPDGKTLAAAVDFPGGTEPQRVMLLDPVAGTPVQDLRTAGPAVRSLAFAPDGKRLLAGSEAGAAGGGLRVWEKADRE